MELLVRSIIQHGGALPRLRVKLVGGGHVVASESEIGSENVRFARNYVARRGLELVGEHVEGDMPRKVVFHPLTGWAGVRMIDASKKRAAARNASLAPA